MESELGRQYSPMTPSPVETSQTITDRLHKSTVKLSDKVKALSDHVSKLQVELTALKNELDKNIVDLENLKLK
jgi:chaperonin cofactor prefoldin